MAASNLPWELDMALLRRLEKRILVPLPNAKARENMIKNNIPSTMTDDDFDYELFSEKLEVIISNSKLNRAIVAQT